MQRQQEDATQQHESDTQLDLSEVYLLVLHWLSAGPCVGAAQALLHEVQQHGLLPRTYTATGLCVLVCRACFCAATADAVGPTSVLRLGLWCSMATGCSTHAQHTNLAPEQLVMCLKHVLSTPFAAQVAACRQPTSSCASNMPGCRPPPCCSCSSSRCSKHEAVGTQEQRYAGLGWFGVGLACVNEQWLVNRLCGFSVSYCSACGVLSNRAELEALGVYAPAFVEREGLSAQGTKSSTVFLGVRGALLHTSSAAAAAALLPTVLRDTLLTTLYCTI